MLWLFLFASLSPAFSTFATITRSSDDGPNAKRPSSLLLSKWNLNLNSKSNSNSKSALFGSGNGPQDRDTDTDTAATSSFLLFPHNNNNNNNKRSNNDPCPWLAVITELDACDTDKRLQETLNALFQAVQRKQVDLISVRVHGPDKDQDQDQDKHDKKNNDENTNTSRNQNAERQERVLKLTHQLRAWADDYQFRVVLSSDWRHVAELAKVHGVHFKESHRQFIPDIRRQDLGQPDLLIGTSAHSIESACAAYRDYHVDYLFIGTCYVTESHPEKDPTQLEGPELPGQVCRAFKDLSKSSSKSSLLADNNKNHSPPPPVVLAIGGIDASNCHTPIQFGANGVATIRAVLQAPSPLDVVQEIKSAMMMGALVEEKVVDEEDD